MEQLHPRHVTWKQLTKGHDRNALWEKMQLEFDEQVNQYDADTWGVGGENKDHRMNIQDKSIHVQTAHVTLAQISTTNRGRIFWLLLSFTLPTANLGLCVLLFLATVNPIYFKLGGRFLLGSEEASLKSFGWAVRRKHMKKETQKTKSVAILRLSDSSTSLMMTTAECKHGCAQPQPGFSEENVRVF